jgi:hypothetical protein
MRPAQRSLPIRFRVETALAALTGALSASTLLWRDWLEVWGVDPDHHDGTVEWLIVGGLFVVSAALTLAARRDWRRAALAR